MKHQQMQVQKVTFAYGYILHETWIRWSTRAAYVSTYEHCMYICIQSHGEGHQLSGLPPVIE